MSAIEIKNLVKVYESGTVALKGVDIQIEKGDFFALLGANGAGKTTIIGILTSVVNKSSGSIKVFGLDHEKDLNKIKKMIGVVPQEFNFSIFEKVIDIIVYQAGYFGIPKKEALKEAEKVLKALDLWEKKDTYSRMLSGGMKRRLMIARALIHRPKLLILDEPTAGVDVELRHGMWKYLKELNKNGTTILLTTHYLEEAEQLCKNVAIIKEGMIVRNDSVKNILKSLESETYVVDIDSETFEVELKNDENFTDFIEQMKKKGVTVKNMRPKGNRLEQLFLNILNN